MNFNVIVFVVFILDAYSNLLQINGMELENLGINTVLDLLRKCNDFNNNIEEIRSPVTNVVNIVKQGCKFAATITDRRSRLATPLSNNAGRDAAPLLRKLFKNLR